MSDERTLGEHGARLDAIERDLQEIQQDIRYIREALAQAQGGWKFLMAFGGFIAAVSGGVTWLASHFTPK